MEKSTQTIPKTCARKQTVTQAWSGQNKGVEERYCVVVCLRTIGYAVIPSC